MVSMKSIAWKAGAAATLAAAIVGLSAGPASAENYKKFNGAVHTGKSMAEAKSKADGDYDSLVASCRRIGGYRWDGYGTGGPTGSGTYTAQAHLDCYYRG